jgi:predicted RNA binding protein YcfA (HicA-like mRNA interferase family)
MVSGKEAVRRLGRIGCRVIRQSGAHAIVQCDECRTIVAVHGGQDLPVGTLHRIVRDLAPCIGKEWLK